MNKKLVAIFITLLSCTGIVTAALAVKSSEIPMSTEEQYPEVRIIEGIAFDKINNKTEQVVFLVMKYNTRENIYLIVGEQVYKMIKLSEEDFGSGTKVFKYESEDGSMLTILAQKFERWGYTSISGDFKDYLITFKPVYIYKYAIEEKYPGLGPISKEAKEEIIEETRPVKRGLNRIANRERIRNMERLIKSAGPLEEWAS